MPVYRHFCKDYKIKHNKNPIKLNCGLLQVLYITPRPVFGCEPAFGGTIFLPSYIFTPFSSFHFCSELVIFIQILISKTYSEWEHPFYNIKCPCCEAERAETISYSILSRFQVRTHTKAAQNTSGIYNTKVLWAISTVFVAYFIKK